MQVRAQFLVNLICATMLKKSRKTVRFKPVQERELLKHRGNLFAIKQKGIYSYHYVLCCFTV